VLYLANPSVQLKVKKMAEYNQKAVDAIEELEKK
jgi:hypothetical protein